LICTSIAVTVSCTIALGVFKLSTAFCGLWKPNAADMKGEFISYAHNDIYFLETNTKTENTNFTNAFTTHRSRDTIKYKPSTKLKHKFNPTLDVFVQNNTEKTASDNKNKNNKETEKCVSGRNAKGSKSKSRRSSMDLYEEAAAILGLTCSETNSCRCLECQCHYFDFEEEIDFQTGNEYMKLQQLETALSTSPATSPKPRSPRAQLKNDVIGKMLLPLATLCFDPLPDDSNNQPATTETGPKAPFFILIPLAKISTVPKNTVDQAVEESREEWNSRQEICQVETIVPVGPGGSEDVEDTLSPEVNKEQDDVFPVPVDSDGIDQPAEDVQRRSLGQ
ncbi:hypothetical protein RN001_001182, partial [Aquatica leii]